MKLLYRLALFLLLVAFATGCAEGQKQNPLRRAPPVSSVAGTEKAPTSAPGQELALPQP